LALIAYFNDTFGEMGCNDKELIETMAQRDKFKGFEQGAFKRTSCVYLSNNDRRKIIVTQNLMR
jgi:hypothetical protein